MLGGRVGGEQVGVARVVRGLAELRPLGREGNVRRITVKDKDGKVIATFPLTVGVIGVVLAPVLAAIGALSAILTDCTLSIEKNA